MPQATDEQRAKMKEYFGDSIDDRGPMTYLLGRGFEEERGMWTNPKMIEVTDKDFDCLNFLVDEWDYCYNVKVT